MPGAPPGWLSEQSEESTWSNKASVATTSSERHVSVPHQLQIESCFSLNRCQKIKHCRGPRREDVARARHAREDLPRAKAFGKPGRCLPGAGGFASFPCALPGTSQGTCQDTAKFCGPHSRPLTRAFSSPSRRFLKDSGPSRAK